MHLKFMQSCKKYLELSSEDECCDEESDFLGNDWNNLVVDDELANMVIDNPSFSKWDE